MAFRKTIRQEVEFVSQERKDFSSVRIDDGYLPSFAWITEGSVADVRIAQGLRLDPGTVFVDDRAYNDYRLFGQWTSQGVYFVTRMKDNAQYEVMGGWKCPKIAISSKMN